MGKILFRKIGGRIVPILSRNNLSVFLTKPANSIKTGSLKYAVEKTRKLRALGKNSQQFKRAQQWSTFYVKEAVKKLPKKWQK